MKNYYDLFVDSIDDSLTYKVFNNTCKGVCHAYVPWIMRENQSLLIEPPHIHKQCSIITLDLTAKAVYFQW